MRLAAGRGPARGIVYLPEGMRPEVLAIRAIGGALAPAPAQRRWLCYGDSIAEGWLASAPARAWPACAARECELDVVNLGYAGGARGEIASAEEIASLPADVITSRTAPTAGGARRTTPRCSAPGSTRSCASCASSTRRSRSSR